MEKGQIVRKLLSSGKPVGTYWVIEGFISANKVAHLLSLSSSNVDCYVKRDRIHVCKLCKLIISHRVYDRIDKEIQSSIIHSSTPKWVQLFEKQPEIIQLRDELYSEHTMMFTVEETKKIFNEYGLQIRLDLGKKIL